MSLGFHSLLLAATLAGSNPSDEPPQVAASPAPVFPVGLDVINVPASVRDGQGRLVGDLRREDFVLFEDGRPQDIQIFGRATEGELSGGKPWLERAMAIDLGMLFDTSESMLKELKLSQEAAVRFLDAIPRARELFTIFFDEEIRVSRYDSENQQGLVERFMEAKGGGNTALYDAIAVYLSRVHGDAGRKVLVLFTDGEDTRSTLELSEILPLVRSSSVVMYPIAFGGDAPSGSLRGLRARAFLQQIADMTGGQLFAPRSSKDLPQIYARILDELSAQYLLGYVSSNPARDGRFRKLKLELRRPGLQARYRPGYSAPGGR